MSHALGFAVAFAASPSASPPVPPSRSERGCRSLELEDADAPAVCAGIVDAFLPCAIGLDLVLEAERSNKRSVFAVEPNGFVLYLLASALLFALLAPFVVALARATLDFTLALFLTPAPALACGLDPAAPALAFGLDRAAFQSYFSRNLSTTATASASACPSSPIGGRPSPLLIFNCFHS